MSHWNRWASFVRGVAAPRPRAGTGLDVDVDEEARPQPQGFSACDAPIPDAPPPVDLAAIDRDLARVLPRFRDEG